MNDDIWGDDLLNVKARGETFTKLIKSIDDSKVISIEAGFGRGKTFFRQAWAEHLRAEGEVVIEIDAQLSDHAGDPVVTFIAALVEALGPKEESTGAKLKKSGLKWAAVGGRAVAGAVIGRAVDGVIEAAGEAAAGDDDTSAALDTLVDGVGDGLSKVAKQLIATQMKAEKARTEELPKQLDSLRFALTMKEGEDAEAKAARENEHGPDRVVILIDELDRCHPEYAIALLEAMKLVFDRKGYVFVLMVNPKNLQKIADHRFGKADKDEKGDDEQYLEKFVDIRLLLGATDEVIGEATRALVLRDLDIVGVPFGEGPEFTVERAAEVAAQLAPLSGLSMRQIKRVLLRVEVALRCYQETPLDLPLLIWLAFTRTNLSPSGNKNAVFNALPRAFLDQKSFKDPSGELALDELLPTWKIKNATGYVAGGKLYHYNGVEGHEPLHGLPMTRYFVADASGERKRHEGWAQASMGSLSLAGLSDMAVESLDSYYLQDHREVLGSTHLIQPTDW